MTPEPVGVGVFELEDGSGLWEVGAYFTDAPDDIALSLLAAAYGARPFAVSELPETDWVAHVRRETAPGGGGGGSTSTAPMTPRAFHRVACRF